MIDYLDGEHDAAAEAMFDRAFAIAANAQAAGDEGPMAELTAILRGMHDAAARFVAKHETPKGRH